MKNTTQLLQTDYLRASRTIDTILVTDGNRSTVVYVYNYEGTHFRLFQNVIELSNFIHGDEFTIIAEELTMDGIYDFIENKYKVHGF